MREKYESLALIDLKAIAKSRGIKGTSTMKKAEVVEAMLQLDEEERQKEKSLQEEEKEMKPVQRQERAAREEDIPREEDERRKRLGEERFPTELDSGITASGILEGMPDGFGFIRCANYLPGENDVYVAPSQIRRFNMKTGDIITGNTRIKTQSEKFSALLYVKNINGFLPDVAAKRRSFEDMTPVFPNERMRLETPGSSVAMRIMDMMSPVG